MSLGMSGFRLPKQVYKSLCEARDLDQFKLIVDAISDEDRNRFGPTTFCPPPSTDLPSPLVTAAVFGQRNEGFDMTGVVKYLVEKFPNAIDINANGRVYQLEDAVCTPLVA